MFGLIGVIFGILGFFSVGLVFIPLGLLCTVISMVSKRGFLLGIPQTLKSRHNGGYCE